MQFPSLPVKPHPLHFRSTTFTALKPGPRLIVLAAVHGNEVCGVAAVLRWIASFECGEHVLQCGSVTFVPVTNPLAYNRERRNGDRNLNRNLTPTQHPQDFEDHVANWLSPLLGQHDVLLDLHSFQEGRVPFALFGPENNAGSLQAFSHAKAERELAMRLGVSRFVDGWLDTYAKGVEKRLRYLSETGRSGDGLNTDPRYGMGTTECMRAQGGYAVTLECGQHDDPESPNVAFLAIGNALIHLGLIKGSTVLAVSQFQHLSLVDVIDKQHVQDQFSKNWSSFDPVKQGDLIGIRHDGQPVMADRDGFIVFPNSTSQAGQEWFYLAVERTSI